MGDNTHPTEGRPFSGRPFCVACATRMRMFIRAMPGYHRYGIYRFQFGKFRFGIIRSISSNILLRRRDVRLKWNPPLIFRS